MDAVRKDIRQWITTILKDNTPLGNAPRLNAARILTDLRVLSANLPHDTSNEKWAVANIRLLQDRLTVVIPLITSIEDSVMELKKAGKLPEYWEYLLDNIASWLEEDNPTPESAQWLRERIRHGLPEITQSSSWDEVLIVHLANNLEKLVTSRENCADQRRTIDDCLKGKAPAAPKTIPVSLNQLTKDRHLALARLCLGYFFHHAGVALLGGERMERRFLCPDDDEYFLPFLHPKR